MTSTTAIALPAPRSATPAHAPVIETSDEDLLTRRVEVGLLQSTGRVLMGLPVQVRAAEVLHAQGWRASHLRVLGDLAEQAVVRRTALARRDIGEPVTAHILGQDLLTGALRAARGGRAVAVTLPWLTALAAEMDPARMERIDAFLRGPGAVGAAAVAA